MDQAVPTVTPLPPARERRRRYRQEMTNAILVASRAVMREQGVAALNLNEVARRLGMSGQAIAKYFPNKAALYDALFLMGHRRFREAEEEVWRTTAPDWERIRCWFERRFDLACAHPDLYTLIWGGGVPGFAPSEASQEDIGLMLAGVRAGIGAVIAAGNLDAGLPPERVVDVLMAMRHGVIAEYLGKRELLPPGSDRFRDLVPDVVAALERAWALPRRSRRAVRTPAATSEEGGGVA